MKKLFIFSLMLILVISSILTIQHNVYAAKQTKLIKQSYTVSAVYDNYIEVQSDQYAKEYINLYYTDQLHREHFSVHDKVVAYFVPYKTSYEIVNFKKVQPKLDSLTYTITSIDQDGSIYGQCTTNKSGVYLTKEYLPKETLQIGDTIKVYFPHDDTSFEEITKVEKVTPKLIKQTFTITSISNGQYQAVNNTKGTDKPRLLFTQSDIKSSHSVSVGDTIEAFYKPMNGEDLFLYIK